MTNNFLGLLFAGFVATAPCTALADVIEISDAGDIQTFAGPTVFRTEGAQTVRHAMGLDKPVPVQADATAPLPTPQPATGAASYRAPLEYIAYFQAAAARYQVDPSLIDAIAHQESRFRVGAVSPKGAIGMCARTSREARLISVRCLIGLAAIKPWR
jgi:hypothetical protein